MLKSTPLVWSRRRRGFSTARRFFVSGLLGRGRVMSRGLIEIGNLNVELAPRPIEPSWIIEGKPAASGCMLSQSADRTATTIVWHCTEGKFNWYYDFDETILILEGSIVLENDTMGPTRYGPGDVIFFRDGAHARWHD